MESLADLRDDEKGEVSTRATVFIVINSIIVASVVLYYLLKPAKKEKKPDVNPDDFEELLQERLANFKPDALMQPLNEFEKLNLKYVHEIKSAPRLKIEVGLKSGATTKELINFASTDFLGFARDESIIIDRATEALNRYGCGSCGPRGFYGTFDVHLHLEKLLAQFFKTENCIVYSDSFTTVPSVIGAFIARQDYIVTDIGCCEAVFNGGHLSRANVITYNHCDVADCKSKIIEAREKMKGKKNTRLFIVTESLFRTTGKVCPLKEIIALKKEFNARILLDESFGFGVLGPQGKGLHEELGIPIEDIEFLTGSLDNVLSSIGGFCVGTEAIVQHQRLMGAGYCFSAAVAPVLSATAIEALQKLSGSVEKGRSSYTSKLNDLLKQFAKAFSETSRAKDAFQIVSDPRSPMCHLKLSDNIAKGMTKLHLYEKVREICEMIAEEGVFVVASVQTPREVGLSWLQPTIRLAFSAIHGEDDIKQLVSALDKVAKKL